MKVKEFPHTTPKVQESYQALKHSKHKQGNNDSKMHRH